MSEIDNEFEFRLGQEEWERIFNRCPGKTHCFLEIDPSVVILKHKCGHYWLRAILNTVCENLEDGKWRIKVIDTPKEVHDKIETYKKHRICLRCEFLEAQNANPK